MANGHGGRRTPSKPAAVSGPGRYSRRTDGRPNQMDLPDAAYGEAQQFRADQSGAPMGDPPVTGSAAAPQAPSLVPLDAPTQRPGEPVTAGAAAGPGPGPEVLGISTDDVARSDLERLRPYLPTFIKQANSPNSTQAFRNWVRDLLAALR